MDRKNSGRSPLFCNTYCSEGPLEGAYRPTPRRSAGPRSRVLRRIPRLGQSTSGMGARLDSANKSQSRLWGMFRSHACPRGGRCSSGYRCVGANKRDRSNYLIGPVPFISLFPAPFISGHSAGNSAKCSANADRSRSGVLAPARSIVNCLGSSDHWRAIRNAHQRKASETRPISNRLMLAIRPRRSGGTKA
jgi:hypothetical protein